MSGNKPSLNAAQQSLYDYMVERRNHLNTNNVFYVGKDEQPHMSSYTGCAAAMGTAAVHNASYIGATSSGWSHFPEFVNWVTGPNSYYAPLMRYLGDDYCQVKTKKGEVCGFIASTNVNTKLLTNFVKSWRAVTEHKVRQEMWSKFVNDGGNPGVAYLLMFSFDKTGTGIQLHHSPIEGSSLGKGVSLERFRNPRHTEWDKIFHVSLTSKKSSYGGENATTHCNDIPAGSKPFFVHKDIPRKSDHDVKVKTYFIEKYRLAKQKEKKYSYEDLLEFCKNPYLK